MPRCVQNIKAIRTHGRTDGVQNLTDLGRTCPENERTARTKPVENGDHLFSEERQLRVFRSIFFFPGVMSYELCSVFVWGGSMSQPTGGDSGGDLFPRPLLPGKKL